jgi:hypothetical protein
MPIHWGSPERRVLPVLDWLDGFGLDVMPTVFVMQQFVV